MSNDDKALCIPGVLLSNDDKVLCIPGDFIVSRYTHCRITTNNKIEGIIRGKGLVVRIITASLITLCNKISR